jgi:hypothetical protein
VGHDGEVIDVPSTSEHLREHELIRSATALSTATRIMRRVPRFNLPELTQHSAPRRMAPLTSTTQRSTVGTQPGEVAVGGWSS